MRSSNQAKIPLIADLRCIALAVMDQNNFENMIPVDGHDGWYRDPSSNAIVNANMDEYDKYMASYNRRKQKKIDKEHFTN